MPYYLKPSKLFVKDPNGDGYLPQNVITDQATEDMVAEIESTGADQISAIEAKASEAMADMSGSTEMEGMVAGTFSENTDYTAGQYVIKNVTSGQSTVNKLYRFTADHPAGAWIGTDATEIKIGNEVSKAAIMDDYRTECAQLGLIPYASNGSTTHSFTVVQNGNEVTLSGTSTATSGQGWTKISITGYIYAWNNTTTPDEVKIYPVKLQAGHSYKIKITVLGGTREPAEGNLGGISVRAIAKEDVFTFDPVYIYASEMEKEAVVTIGTDCNVRLILTVQRLMTVTDLRMRIELSDVTDAVAINGKQDTLTFDETPTQDSTNPVTSGGLYDYLEDVNGILGRDECVYTNGGIVTSGYSGDIIDIDTVDVGSSFVHCVTECEPGEKFVILGSGGPTSRRLYAFVYTENEEHKLTSELAESNEEHLDGGYIITAPDNATHLVSNAFKTSPHHLYRGTTIDVRVDNLEKNLEDIKAIKETVGGTICEYKAKGYVPTVAPVDVTYVNYSLTFAHCVVPCQEGDEFVISGHGGKTGQRLYAFVREDGAMLSSPLATSDEAADNLVITAPEDAVYLVSNVRVAHPYYLYKGRPVKDRLDELRDGLSKKVDAFDIPSYYDENNYLAGKINSVLERSLTITGDSFIFVTDYHAHKNTGHTPAIVNRIFEQTGISKLFCGGDIGTSTGLGSIKTNSAAIKTLRSAIPNFYACVGNHEWKVSDGSYPSASYNTVYNYYMSQMEAGTSHMSDFGDFWIDSKGAKIRYFFLNQNISTRLTDTSLKWFMRELPDIPAGYGIVVVMHHAYHSKTYKTVGSRKSFGMLNWWDNDVGLRNLTVRRISQILNAVRTRTSVKYALRPYENSGLDRKLYVTPYECTTAEKNKRGVYDPIASTFESGINTGEYTDIVTFDGASMNDGVYPIAIFCGHKHEDAAYDPASASSFSDMTDDNTVYLLNGTWYRYDSDETSITYGERVAMNPAAGASDLSQTETVPPILVILTTTDCYALNHPDTDPTVREKGTISEQAFEIVQIDTNARKVYCTRIGAGNDRVFSY